MQDIIAGFLMFQREVFTNAMIGFHDPRLRADSESYDCGAMGLSGQAPEHEADHAAARHCGERFRWSPLQRAQERHQVLLLLRG